MWKNHQSAMFRNRYWNRAPDVKNEKKKKKKKKEKNVHTHTHTQWYGKCRNKAQMSPDSDVQYAYVRYHL